MELTASVSTEAVPAPIMVVLQNGSNSDAKSKVGMTMQEVLTRTVDPTAPLQGQEFYELNLVDEAHDLGTRYCVRQAHAEWSEIDGQVMWDDEQVEYFWILNEAKRRYAERRIALAEEGFIYSDMDTIF
jgi:hypothetical protein